MQKNKTNNSGRLYILYSASIFPNTNPVTITNWSQFETYTPELPDDPGSYMTLVSDMSTYPLSLGQPPSGDSEFEILSAAKVALLSNSIAEATTNDLEPKWQGPVMWAIMGLASLVVVILILIVLVGMF